MNGRGNNSVPYGVGPEEDISEEELKARVALICKRGDTNNYESYMPISLPSTLYKISAAI